MRPFKLELILGAKVSPRVAIRSKWAGSAQIHPERAWVDVDCRLRPRGERDAGTTEREEGRG